MIRLDQKMNLNKIESRLGLNRIKSLNQSNNPKTKQVYSLMIIVNKGLKLKDIEIKCMKINDCI